MRPVILCLLFAFLAALPMLGEDDGGSVPVKRNRLKDERSPYLRQHQTNPVDWYPWGDEASKRAKDEDKPIFLSIGYAACHWCHVMEHESFEDVETAKLLNEHFVCVKVDREERPDLDRIYMTAVQVMTGRGGWPMTVLLLPDGRPFWGGTYIPREALKKLTTQVTALWKSDREKIESQAGALTERVQSMADGMDLPDTGGSDADLIHHMRIALRAGFDPKHGGYGTRPKFPPHTEMLFYLDPDGASDEELDQARRTLEAMDEGGIHDHVGGGFHRYSTDARWFLPHFEKMLYDNALLMQAYAGMYARTKDPRFARVVDRMAGWLERAMRRPGGGYASSLDADTRTEAHPHGEEGLTYTWTHEELAAVLGDDAPLAGEVFGFVRGGNFQDEASGETVGRNIVYLPQPLALVAPGRDTDPETLRARLDKVLEAMLAVRVDRAQPGLDDKVISGWNALLISGFVRAGVDLERPEYIARAKALADALLADCLRDDGVLLRFPKASGPEIVGFCEDYVHVISALLDLADATGDDARAETAEALARRLLEEYEDAEGGGFWTTSRRAHQALFARSKESMDTPIPSDNGTAALAMYRLFERTGDQTFRTAGDRTLAAFRPMLAQPRLSSMLVQMFRALRYRLALEAAGAADAVRGDVHVREDVARVDVFAERTTAKLGSRVSVVVRVELDAGWHVNAHDVAAEALVATRLTAVDGAPAALEAVVYPAAVERTVGSEPTRLLEGRFDIRADLVVPNDVPTGPRTVVLTLTLQACNDSMCKAPMDIALELPLRFGDQDGPAQHGALFK